MAKKLTMTRDGNTINNCNSGDKKIGFDLFIKDIKYQEPFLSIFSISDDVLEAITTNMKINGYDSSKPVVIWKKPNGDKVLIDGHTRVKAAEQAGLIKVVAYQILFSDERDAVIYITHTQRNRRNTTNWDLITLIQYFDKLKKPGFTSASRDAEVLPERSSEFTAKCIGISKSTVERARAVIKNPKELELVKKGIKSINQAYKSLHKKSKDIKEKITEQIPQEPPLAPLDPYKSLKKFHTTLENAIQDLRLSELEIAPEDKESFILKGKIESLEWANEEALRIFPKIPANKSIFGTDITSPPSK